MTMTYDKGRSARMAKKRRHRGPRYLPVRTTPRDGWGIALEVGGVVQSVTVPLTREAAPDTAGVDQEPQPGPGGGYWGLLLPPGCPRRALLLGLGGGTVAWLLARRCPDVAIIGIERDATVLAVARAELGLDALGQLTAVEADAFAWVAEHAGSEPDTYDLICLDLFEGGRLALGALGTPFLRQVAELLAPDGTLTVNLMVTARTPDQARRLRRLFVVMRELRLRGNLILHARRPRRGEHTAEQDVE
jgi:predicted O-methyltransferase YrrM